ncbi:hypothetical protein [Salinimonas lutimaris]|uniref:hypothetical protein n=1 Tax=Salinimonas lutimaris TaxID=914153 RepID=UPI0010C04440|nr:hypothetical protein [Salinimonas lutimaris]
MKSKKKSLILHIGTGKTATTAIQHFLYNSHAYLSKFNAKYVESGLIDDNHHLLCRNFMRGHTSTQDDISQSILDLKKELSESDYSSYIVSSEYFPGLALEEIKELAEAVSGLAEVKVIVYLRRQDRYLESWYLQLLKSGNFNHSLEVLRERLIQDKIFDYPYLIDLWSKIFGKNNVIVRPYEKSQFFKSDILKDFLNSLDMFDEEFEVQIKSISANSSLSRQQAILGNKILSMYESPSSELISFVRTPILGYKGDIDLMNFIERKQFLSLFEEDNRLLSNMYLNGESFFGEIQSEKTSFWLDSELLLKFTDAMTLLGEAEFIKAKNSLIQILDNLLEEESLNDEYKLYRRFLYNFKPFSI